MAETAHSEPSPWRYFAVWLSLAVLTTATWGLVYIDRGATGFFLGFGIAVAKATLVALFFMHLWDQRGINRLVFVVALCFLGIFIGLVVADAGSRFPLSLVRGPHLRVPSR